MKSQKITYNTEFISGEYRIVKYDNGRKIREIWAGPRDICLNGCSNLNLAEKLYNENKFIRMK